MRSPSTAARVVAVAACVGALAFGTAPASAQVSGLGTSQVITAQALPSAGFAFPPFAVPGELVLVTGGFAPGYYQWDGSVWVFVAPESALVDVGGVFYAWSTDTAAFVEVQAPVATISSPAGGGSYTVGQLVSTTFSCAESDIGPGLASCDDNAGTNTASGGTGTLDTSTPGSFTYSVVATSLDGLSATASIDYTVVAAPPCSPGTYSSSGYEPCVAAPLGSFVDGTGATGATPCVIGTTTSSTGSTSAADCHATLASLRAALPTLVPDPSTTNQLDTSLAAAQQSAARGNWIAAANQLGAFINKAGAALNSRRLTQGTASLLSGLAASIQRAFDAGHNP